jgi:hypothetical protein
VLVGVFMTIPPPGVDAPLPTRTGLFQLLPIALMALMVRPVSLLSMIAVLLGLAALRVALHGGIGSTRRRSSGSVCCSAAIARTSRSPRSSSASG